MLHAIAAVTRRWPFWPGAAVFNRAVEPLVRPARGPRWAVSPPAGECPALALDLCDRLQRKTFLFPRAYARCYLGAPLGRFLSRALRPGDSFVDAGANLGFYTLHAARLVGPEGRVLAFEPDPAAFASLSRSIALGGLAQVAAVRAALSDREGEATLLRDPNGLATSLVPEAPSRARRYRGAVTVPTTTLDAHVRACGVDVARLALVKVDVEGEEARAVAGMLDTLARAGRPPVWCEVRGPRGSTRAPGTFAQVAALLAPLGYRPGIRDGRRRGRARPVTARDLGRRGSFDALFSV